MIRVIFFLLLIALLALGVAWMADRPGDVAIVWQGYRIETSLMVTVVALAVVIVVALLLWSLVRTILRSPDLVAMFIGQRRGVRGYNAISRGLVAIGSGDARAARKFADEADRIAPGEPLALLLNAQVAQLAGDRAAAQHAFQVMAARDDTKLLGLRGLYIEAQRRNDATAARAHAEEAAKSAPGLAWAGQAVLEFRCAAGDWIGAQAALDRNSKYGLIEKADFKRQRAVLLTARALAAEESDRSRARTLALDALKLEPGLVPAAELAARLIAEAGDLKKSARILEAAWRANPHPELADAYAHLRPGDSARERMSRVEALARQVPGDVESALAVARAALDAQEFATARAALKPLLGDPTQRVAELMAELEQKENGDEGRAREWMARAVHARRDPAWTADGVVSDRWMPVSPGSGRLDAFKWKVPLAELGGRGPTIESAEPAVVAPVVPVEAAPAVVEALPEIPVVSEPPQVQEKTGQAEPRPSRRGIKTAAPRAEAVIPLVLVPDDPGPEPMPETEFPDGGRFRPPQ